MSTNVGCLDRAVRLVLGLALIVLPLAGVMADTALYWGSLVVGVVLVATAAFRFCPLYRLVGVSTCKVPRR